MAKKRPPQIVPAGVQPTSQANTVSEQATSGEDSARSEQDLAVETSQALNSPTLRPSYPAWPTSKRGPQSTPPPPGMRSMNSLRPEQLAEIAYNQETGEPSVDSPARSLPSENQGSLSLEQSETAQEAERRRKKEQS